jgi:fatty-acyl-CoA synthase
MREALMMDDYPLSLTNLIRRAEQFSGHQKVAFRRPDGSIGHTTMGACVERSTRLASALSQLGVGDGDPVATLLWNQPEHLELYFAVPCMAAVLHTLNPRLHPDELSFIVNDAEDKAIVVDETLLPVFETFHDARAFSDVIVVRRTDAALPDGYLDYEQLLDGAEPMQWPADDERRAAAMCYTSGTTGRPKGVVYSHRSMVLHSLVAALPDVKAVSKRDVLLPVVPMFHANAWGMIYTAALVGSALVLPGPKLDAVSVLDLLADERVTITAGVPTVWMAVLEALEAEPDRWDLSALDHLIVGGSAAPPSMMERFDRFGLTIIHAWVDDRDLPARERLPPARRARRRLRAGAPALPGAAGHRLAVRRDPGPQRRRGAGCLGRRGDGRARGPRPVGRTGLPPWSGGREVHRRRLVCHR